MNTYRINDGLSQGEIIRLMRILYTDDENTQREIAAELHTKKSDLCCVKWNFEFQAIDLKNEKIKAVDFSEPTKMILELVDDLRAISHRIYPKLIDYMGLLKNLESYVANLIEHDSYKIQLNIPKTEIKVAKDSEVGAFKLCVEILSILGKNQESTLILNVNYNVNVCYFSFLSDIDLPEIPEIKHKLDVIKARMMCLQAIVSTETNWKNCFSFGIS